jgi:hypothetical protein
LRSAGYFYVEPLMFGFIAHWHERRMVMFATLVGTNTNNATHPALFEQLYGVATAQGFTPPDTSMRISADGSLEGWVLEQKGPSNQAADFYLAVTAPRVPGISPIFPVFKTISGLLFAVVVLDSAFVLSREDRRDVQEVKNTEAVVGAFQEFINGLRKRA